MMKNNKHMKKINLIIVILTIGLFSSCSNAVDFGEQYEKIIYIVNSKEIIYYAAHLPVEESEGSISFYCSGTELPDEDIHIRYKIDSEALAEYNKNEFGDKTDRYFLQVPEELVKYETDEVVIKKGEEYAPLRFSVNVLGLSPGRLYMIPVSIESADGYSINPDERLILYSLRIQNDYAGNYTSIFQVGGEKTPVNKTIIPLSVNQILVPLAGRSNDAAYETGYYRIQIEEDNSLTLLPYLQSEIEAQTIEGVETNYYNPENKTFYLYYNIFDQWGDPISVQETLIKM